LNAPNEPRAAQVEAALAEARAQIPAEVNEADPVALHLPHLARSMKIVQRYAAVYSDAPFVSNLPLFGPLIVLAKNLVRGVLRLALRGAFGSQGEFNAAAADILFEFTRRATLPQNSPRTEMRLAPILDPLARSGQAEDREAAAALGRFVQELEALRESIRAANLAAADTEREVMQLRQEVEKLRRANGLQ
jgi:hypothetical protein